MRRRFPGIVAPDTALEQLAAGFGLTEGPVWRGDHLLFSDIPRSRTVRYRPLPEGPEFTTFRANTGGGNGLALDAAGRLIVREQIARRLSCEFADMTSTDIGRPDGLKTDVAGNLYCTGGRCSHPVAGRHAVGPHPLPVACCSLFHEGGKMESRPGVDKATFDKVADAIVAQCGPVDGEHRYIGTVAPATGVPLAHVQTILDRLERIGVVECTVANPLQCRLTKSGKAMLNRKARKAAGG